MTTAKFFTACSTGKVDVVLSYIDAGIGTNARDSYNFTGLIWAGRKGQVAIAKALLNMSESISPFSCPAKVAPSRTIPVGS